MGAIYGHVFLPDAHHPLTCACHTTLILVHLGILPVFGSQSKSAEPQSLWCCSILNKSTDHLPPHSHSPVSEIGTLIRHSILHLWLTHPLVTVCVLLLDLFVTLAKSYLVLVFSVEDTSIQAHSLSWEPSLRAFFWCSFAHLFCIDTNLFAL